MKITTDIIGHKGKGGGSSRAPVESADSLRSISYARVLDLISEGEIAGFAAPDGSLRPAGQEAKSVYLDGTPLMAEDGTLAYSNVYLDWRAGTQQQSYIPGFPSVESETAVGVELRSGTPWARSITNTQLSAVRVRLSVLALSKTNTSNGDITGYRIDYAIDVATDGGAYQQVLTASFDGKTTSQYSRTHRIDLPAATSGWQVRVRRITANANSATIADTTRVESITEVIDAKLRYPMSALVGIRVDAQQFQSIPTRAYLIKGRVLKVPTNYDPIARSYSGVWDGTFQLAWSNNPAWVFYDLVLSDRYGVGHLISSAQVDKWALYQIAQWCDVLVSDGKGGTEPRFTCNAYIQTQADGWKLLQDLVSVFRGITYWAGGQVMTGADMPSDPVYTFTQANVIGGRFSYSGSARKTRHTVALVSWNDPADQYRAKVAYCEDRDGIARYGVRQVSLTAFGCTSEAQAQRAGQWALLTARLETETVSFSVGLDGVIPAPGKIIAVADANRAGRRIGGRIKSASGRVVTVDKLPAQATVGDTLTVALPSGITQTQTITAINGDAVTVAANWSALPQPEAVWLLQSASLKAQLFRVLSIAEGKGEGEGRPLQFDITAVRHEPSKYPAIDNGARIDPRPVSVIPPGIQPPPTGVLITSNSVIDQGIARHVMTISWQAATSAVQYEVQWRRDSGEWVTVPRTGGLSVDIPGVYTGQYLARVRAINARDIGSIWATGVLTSVQGKTGTPPAVSSLTASGKLFGIDLAWSIPASASDTQRTEVWYATVNDRAQAIKLGDYAYPQATHSLMGLSAGATLYFWARLVDRSGNVGPWYPSSGGVQGIASSDAGPILQYLAGQIGETQLAQALVTKINSTNNAEVQVQQLASDLAAMYTIKTQLTVDGRTYIAGIGVGVENDQGQVESQVLVAAQRFAVIDESTGQLRTPFVIQGGATYINQAFIADGTITNAKIGNVIQSENYDEANGTGWKLDKLGNLTATNLNAATGTFSGTLTTNAVNAVSTINIAGDAVTVTRQGTYTNPYHESVGPLYTTLITLPAINFQGGAAVVFFGMTVYAQGPFSLRVARYQPPKITDEYGNDATQYIDVAVVNLPAGTHRLNEMVIDYPGAGDHIYFLMSPNTNSPDYSAGKRLDAYDMKLAVMGAKR